MRQETRCRGARLARTSFARTRINALAAVSIVALAAGMGPAQAFEFETGNPDLAIRWDNTVRYNIGVRAEGVNSGFAASPTYDETERKFKRGDIMSNRIDVLSEFDATYLGKHGVRVSGAGWYDQAYHSATADTNPSLAGTGSYVDNNYTGTTKRFHRGPSGEILDAFAFTGFELGETSVRAKAGRHTVYWGESLYSAFHSIAYSQSPLDGLKSASSPGITAKESFLPLNQISMQIQPTPELAFDAQYYLQWEPNRLPQGGTYFGSADHLFSGPERLYVASAGGRPIFAPHGQDVEPRHGAGNNFGLAAHWSPAWLDGTAGAYYRKFDETMPWNSVLTVSRTSPLPTSYHQSYAKDTQLGAFSLNKSIGPVSVGLEAIYRHGTALNSASSFAATGDLAGVEGARGNTAHFLANGVYVLPQTPLWVGGTLQGELVYSRLLDVTKNAALYKGVGYGGCPAGQGIKDGCATRDVVLMQVGFTPEWPEVFPGVNLALPISFSYGIYGNGATLGGGNQGAYSYSVGVQAKIRQRYLVTLKYNDQYARYNTSNGVVTTVSGNAVQSDHGWASLAFETTF